MDDKGTVTARGRTFRVNEPSYQDVITSRDENLKADLGDARLLSRTAVELVDGAEKRLALADVLAMPFGLTAALSRELKKRLDSEPFEDAEKN